jgi:hypothetical protein
MFTGHMVRPLAAALGLASLLAGTLALDYSQFRCKIDEVARPACCCGKQVVDDQPTAVSTAGCCDVESFHFTIAPSESRQAASDSVILASINVPQATIIASSRIVERTLDLRIADPPLILLKHSLLIWICPRLICDARGVVCLAGRQVQCCAKEISDRGA